MNDVLLRSIRKAREGKVVVGKFTFLYRRPTDVEALELHKSGGAYVEMCQRFVFGWEDVTEDDIIGGAVMDPQLFDAEVWKEWCADRPDFWAPIATAILKAYEEHAAKLESSAGE